MKKFYLQKIVAVPISHNTLEARIAIGLKTRVITYTKEPSQEIKISITTIQNSANDSQPITFHIPFDLQKKDTISNILRDTLSLIIRNDTLNEEQSRSYKIINSQIRLLQMSPIEQKENIAIHQESLKQNSINFQAQKMKLFQNISTIEFNLKQFLMKPEHIAQNIDITLDHFLLHLLFNPKKYEEAQGITIFTCGRPNPLHFSLEDQNSIHAIALELETFLNATTTQETTQTAPPRPNYPNQGSILVPETDIPEPFKRWLPYIGSLIEGEMLTDTYSIYQSIRFLMAKNKINYLESTSYSLNERYATHNISNEIWILKLAQVMFLVERHYADKFEIVGHFNWEKTIEELLKEQLGFPDSEFKNYICRLNISPNDSPTELPGINEDPRPFLNQFNHPSVAQEYESMSEVQQNLIKGLVYCKKVKIKEFILGFTAGAKGRHRNAQTPFSAEYFGQCGMEYAKRAQSSIESLTQTTSEPQSFSELIFNMIKTIRVEVLREILVTTNRENTGFEGLLNQIENMKNPDLELFITPGVTQYQAEAFIEKMKLSTCVSKLQEIFLHATEKEKNKWTALINDWENVSIESLSKSELAIYRYLETLGLCQQNNNWIPIKPQEQDDLIKSLIYKILFLTPDEYELSNQQLDFTEPSHIEVFDIVKQMLLKKCTELSGLSNENKTLIDETICNNGANLSEKDILEKYSLSNKRGLLDRLKFVNLELTSKLVDYYRNATLRSNNSDNIKVDKLIAFYRSVNFAKHSKLIREEHKIIQESNLHYRQKTELIKVLYSSNPQLFTEELIQEEQQKLLASDLDIKYKIIYILDLYSLNRQSLSKELIDKVVPYIDTSSLPLYQKEDLVRRLYSKIGINMHFEKSAKSHYPSNGHKTTIIHNTKPAYKKKSA